MDLGVAETAGLLDYPNVPGLVGLAVSSGKVSFEALATVLDLEDLWVVVEIVLIDAHNKRRVNEKAERELQ